MSIFKVNLCNKKENEKKSRVQIWLLSGLEKNSVMGFKKGINKCVECEKKIKEDPDETGMCSKCGAAETRIEKTLYKELIDEGRFP